jgi:hypothetical protein
MTKKRVKCSCGATLFFVDIQDGYRLKCCNCFAETRLPNNPDEIKLAIKPSEVKEHESQTEEEKSASGTN